MSSLPVCVWVERRMFISGSSRVISLAILLPNVTSVPFAGHMMEKRMDGVNLIEGGMISGMTCSFLSAVVRLIIWSDMIWKF